jgi:hypothetical protein
MTLTELKWHQRYSCISGPTDNHPPKRALRSNQGASTSPGLGSQARLPSHEQSHNSCSVATGLRETKGAAGPYRCKTADGAAIPRQCGNNRHGPHVPAGTRLSARPRTERTPMAKLTRRETASWDKCHWCGAQETVMILFRLSQAEDNLSLPRAVRCLTLLFAFNNTTGSLSCSSSSCNGHLKTT